MRRAPWIGTVGTVLAVVAVSLIAVPDGSRWTTASPAARAEFEAALEANAKLYSVDALRHLESAVALDPDFVTAKLELAMALGEVEAHRSRALMEEVLAADTTPMRPLERLMVERARAFFEDRPEDAEALLDDYLVEYPEDPFALRRKAEALASRGEGQAAEALYHRLLETSPNWALAYNQLGYLAMAGGRFAEAEEYFTSYRFIAPDQANPHDSLGELLIIRGRFEEAARSFATAVEIKQDFPQPHAHLVMALALLGDHTEAEAVPERLALAGVLDDSAVAAVHCSARAWRLMLDPGRRPEAQDSDPGSPCLDNPHTGRLGLIAAHREACAGGRLEVALGLEARVAASDGGSPHDRELRAAELAHLRGVRLARLGRSEEALGLLYDADQLLCFRTAVEGFLKLYNRLLMVEILLAQGHGEHAHAMLDRVREVNPALAGAFEANGLAILDLG